jgi:hypothetical protein
VTRKTSSSTCRLWAGREGHVSLPLLQVHPLCNASLPNLIVPKQGQVAVSGLLRCVCSPQSLQESVFFFTVLSQNQVAECGSLWCLCISQRLRESVCCLQAEGGKQDGGEGLREDTLQVRTGVAPGSFLDLLMSAKDRTTGRAFTDLELANQARASQQCLSREILGVRT